MLTNCYKLLVAVVVESSFKACALQLGNFKVLQNMQHNTSLSKLFQTKEKVNCMF